MDIVLSNEVLWEAREFFEAAPYELEISAPKPTWKETHTFNLRKRTGPELSGRDIKNLLKLALMVARDRHTPITADMIADVKEFKPTSGD